MGRDVSRRFSQEDSGFPKKTSLFKKFQEAELSREFSSNFRIVDKPIKYDADTIQGRFKNFVSPKGERFAEIYFNAELNLCWRRFVYTKELCHLCNYGDESRRASSVEDVDELITKLLSGISTVDLNSKTAVSSDYAAILTALEVLLPYSEHGSVDEMLKTKTVQEAAKVYLIPVQYLTLYCSKDYREVMARVYKLAP